MRKQKHTLFGLFTFLIFSASCAQSAKKSENSYSKAKPHVSSYQLNSPLTSDQSVLHELTGKPVSNIPTQVQLKNKPKSAQHYYAGLRAAEAKNYIMAIKHFNTVLKNYPRSSEVKPAFTAKAKVYNDMGLTQPAQLNMRMASGAMPVVAKKKTAQVQGATKIKR